MGVRLWSGNATLHSIVSIIGPGGTFGWSSLIEPYEATLTAETTTEAALVARDASALRDMLVEDSVMGFHVMTGLAGLIGSRLRGIRRSWMEGKAADLRKAPLKEVVYS